MTDNNDPRTPIRNPSVSQSLSPESSNQATRASPTPLSSHRASFSESRSRFVPPSPRLRTTRQPSMGQQAFQELVNNPPMPHEGDNSFEGRDWKTVKLSEVVDPGQVRWAEYNTSVEDATYRLIEGGSPNVVLVRRDSNSQVAASTFDFGDLNAYLLFAVGLARPGEGPVSSFNELIKKAREGKTVNLGDIQHLGQKEELITLPASANLTQAVEMLGSGTHRIIVVKEGTQDVEGVLTQVRLVRFFWEHGRHFEAVYDLFHRTLNDLGVGPRVVHSVNGDKPLTDALEMMANGSISSVPVLDNHSNVVGNISQVDVRLLTKSTSLPLLRSSCMHFISVILSERGMEDGKDSVPVFYITPQSTLAHTLAKLVATRSHRMWMVDDNSPTQSAPQTPIATAHAPSAALGASATHVSPYAATVGASVPAASLPGQHMSGHLCGVISLTDVLNLFAVAGGLSPMRPDAARNRRRSSSSSLRASVDSTRSSVTSLDMGPSKR